MIQINSNFDSGNIQVIEATRADNIRLNIKPDVGGEFFQWFHFRINGIKGEELVIFIENANESAFPDGWNDYNACVSYDRQTWFRTNSEYDGEELTIRHTAEADTIYFAYFAPYSLERHRDLIAQSQLHPRCQHQVIGKSINGDDMDMLIIGDPDNASLKLWAIARQHPGETMAEWWMEGFIGRLLDDDDPVVREILSDACFYIIPNMNPDGSRMGHLRTNAAGVNLNREWQNPSMDKSPEVFIADQKMKEIGLDFCLDVHGDENLAYNFIAGADEIPNISDKLIKLRVDFENAFEKANPDFQQQYGYPEKAAGEANMTMASSHIAATHNALAMTLEMPFKDNDNAPDPYQGWSNVKSAKLGASSVDAIYAIIPDIL